MFHAILSAQKNFTPKFFSLQIFLGEARCDTMLPSISFSNPFCKLTALKQLRMIFFTCVKRKVIGWCAGPPWPEVFDVQSKSKDWCSQQRCDCTKQWASVPLQWRCANNTAQETVSNKKVVPPCETSWFSLHWSSQTPKALPLCSSAVSLGLYREDIEFRNLTDPRDLKRINLQREMKHCASYWRACMKVIVSQETCFSAEPFRRCTLATTRAFTFACFRLISASWENKCRDKWRQIALGSSCTTAKLCIKCESFWLSFYWKKAK